MKSAKLEKRARIFCVSFVPFKKKNKGVNFASNFLQTPCIFSLRANKEVFPGKTSVREEESLSIKLDFVKTQPVLERTSGDSWRAYLSGSSCEKSGVIDLPFHEVFAACLESLRRGVKNDRNCRKTFVAT